MKCLGLIGGIGWESTALYYRLINEDVRRRFGSLHSARLLVNSLSFEPLDTLVKANQWIDIGAMLAEAARQLERAGAEAVVLCSNQMHYVAGQIQAAVGIPLLHIGPAICRSFGKSRNDVGFLGTRFTLDRDFLLESQPNYPHWRKRRIHVPGEADCARLDNIIYREICRGLVRPDSGKEVLKMATQLRSKGAKRVVLVSSELSLILNPADLPLWLDDSAELHAAEVVRWALDEIPGSKDNSHATMPELPGDRLIKRSKLAAMASA